MRPVTIQADVVAVVTALVGIIWAIATDAWIFPRVLGLLAISAVVFGNLTLLIK